MPLAGIPRGILSGGQVEKGPLSTRSGVTTCDLTRPVQDVVTPLVGVRPAHLHSLQKNEPHPLDSAHRVLLRNRQVTLREV